MTDTSTGGRFDPRFNPAFQPGYDPAVHESPPVVAERAPVPELVEHPLPPVAAAPVSGAMPAQLPDEATVPLARRFDPYLAALWALSVAFVAAGLLTVRYIADRMDRLNTTGGGSAFDYNLVLVYTIAAPLLVILGLATATATLFVLASRRR
ncbi:hypothetical protein [Lacisediminihabitans sp. H27-G8]|uniref:hypothetical protein n=1 Tax=Lacisediminihabitans sp. H27-G8 TaxID=3111909 RepID=UPI0038FD1059